MCAAPKEILVPEPADGAARAVRPNDELAESVLVEAALRDSHFDVAVGRRQIDGACDLLDRGPNPRPAGRGQHNDGDSAFGVP
jgi:hypothetical protein